MKTNLTSYNREIEWTYKNKYMQNKNLRWFCRNPEDKKVKLLLTTQQNQSFCYHTLMWKTNWLSRSSHRIYSKNKQTNKQSCSKSSSQFHIPQTNTYANMFTVIFSLFHKNDILKTRLHFLHLVSFRMNWHWKAFTFNNDKIHH